MTTGPAQADSANVLACARLMSWQSACRASLLHDPARMRDDSVCCGLNEAASRSDGGSVPQRENVWTKSSGTTARAWQVVLVWEHKPQNTPIGEPLVMRVAELTKVSVAQVERLGVA